MAGGLRTRAPAMLKSLKGLLAATDVDGEPEALTHPVAAPQPASEPEPPEATDPAAAAAAFTHLPEAAEQAPATVQAAAAPENMLRSFVGSEAATPELVSVLAAQCKHCSRSVLLLLSNPTPHTLTLRLAPGTSAAVQLVHGAWLVAPPEVIGPFSETLIASGSRGRVPGASEARVSYGLSNLPANLSADDDGGEEAVNAGSSSIPAGAAAPGLSSEDAAVCFQMHWENPVLSKLQLSCVTARATASPPTITTTPVTATEEGEEEREEVPAVSPTGARPANGAAAGYAGDWQMVLGLSTASLLQPDTMAGDSSSSSSSSYGCVYN